MPYPGAAPADARDSNLGSTLSVGCHLLVTGGSRNLQMCLGGFREGSRCEIGGLDWVSSGTEVVLRGRLGAGLRVRWYRASWFDARLVRRLVCLGANRVGYEAVRQVGIWFVRSAISLGLGP